MCCRNRSTVLLYIRSIYLLLRKGCALRQLQYWIRRPCERTAQTTHLSLGQSKGCLIDVSAFSKLENPSHDTSKAMAGKLPLEDGAIEMIRPKLVQAIHAQKSHRRLNLIAEQLNRF